MECIPLWGVGKTDVNPEETVSQNSRKPEFWLIWRPKMATNLSVLGPVFYTPTKVAPASL